MGRTYEKQIDQDLKISEQAVIESLDFLIEDKLIRSVKSEDKRKKEYELTPAGLRAAQAVADMVQIVMASVAGRLGGK